MVVDFEKLSSLHAGSAPTDPLKVFQRLPKPPNINDLWESQSEALKLWVKRRNENDLVIKLNTGGGKTLVGLLIGQALLNELNKPVLYLCPNNQLVRQTAEKAKQIGLPSEVYQAGPGKFQSAFLNSAAILIGSYKALFHGRSKFGILGGKTEPVNLGGIICDDAHAAFSVVRDAFSISINRYEHAELYGRLATEFRADFSAIGKLGSFDDIVEREQPEVLEVPYIAWAAKADAIRQLLARDYADTFKYELPLLRDNFDSCHALISSYDVYITPTQPLVHLLPSFAECPRRVYMSATIADDSSIVRTFDANSKSIASPIVPQTLAGVGERMILAPSLTKIEALEELSLTQGLAAEVAQKAGAVILVPSEKAAGRWENHATLVTGSGVDTAVEQLVTGADRGPFVFANRYDGIDLHGDACRLLVLDDLPRGANTYELYRAEVLQASSSINISLAQKIEQGLGRATRGAGDYCVVILLGADLVSWITRNDSLKLMTPSTRAQVLMGHEISKSITSKEELSKAIEQCLSRDISWTKYHAGTLADRAETPTLDNSGISAAAAERKFTTAMTARQYTDASYLASNFAEQHQPDKKLRSWFLQLAARAAYYANDHERAKELQKKAFMANPILWAPVGMAEIYSPASAVGNQAENIITQIAKFALPSGHLQEFEAAMSWITPAASSNQLEEGLKRLGTFLGFHSERPEKDYKLGPDVLWLPEADFGMVIESKGNKTSGTALGKEAHGQLLVSVEWFNQQYPNKKCIRVQIHHSDKATENAIAQETYVLTFEGLGKLISALRALLTEVCHAQTNSQGRLKLCEKLLAEHNLTPDALVTVYMAKFVVA